MNEKPDATETDALPPDVPLETPKKRTKEQRLAHEVSYGLKQTLTCWATDFLDPPISSWYMKHFGKKGQGGGIEQTAGGEVVGDTAAFFAYIGLKQMFRSPIDMAINAVKSMGDASLTRMGKKSIAGWARSHGISEDDPRFKQRVEDYKQFQAENIVDSSIISVSATGLNVLAQRHMFGNNQTYGTILKSKLLGAGLTLGVMGGMNIVFPAASKAFDNELEERYVSKIIHKTKKMLGLKTDDVLPVITKTPEGQTPSDILTISPEKREGLVIMVAEHAQKLDFNNPEQRANLLGRQKSVYEAFIKALSSDSPVLKAMEQEHYEVVRKAHKKHAFDKEPDQYEQDRETSHAHVQLSAAHKRRDMQQFIALLDDPKFLDEVKAMVASGKLAERRNSSITAEQKTYMSESLLKQSSDSGKSVFETAEAQALDYKALAHALEPTGKAAYALAAELKKHLPTYDPKDIDGIAKDYAGYYQQEARTMAQELSQQSPIVLQAAERSNALRSRFQAPEASYAQAM